jgi:hypothetical protein
MLKLEIITLLLGLIAGLTSFVLVTWWGVFPEDLISFFRAGNVGGKILGFGLIVGFIGVISLIINLVIGNRKKWWLRIFGAVWFLLSSITFGLAV